MVDDCVPVIRPALRFLQAVIDWEFAPVEKKYELLTRHGVKGLSQEEKAELHGLRKTWLDLKRFSDNVADNLGERQGSLRASLMSDTRLFRETVRDFCVEFATNGPGIEGITPEDAIERLRAQESDFELIDRKLTQLNSGEVLFGMPRTELNELTKTRKELKLYKQLYDLYEAVDSTEDEYKEILWVDVVANIESMMNQVNEFQRACKAMPRALKEWDAYKTLRAKIDDLLETVPLLQLLSNKAMMERHWQQLEEVTGCKFHMDPEQFKLKKLLAAGLLAVADEIEEISQGASKELAVSTKLEEIIAQWGKLEFSFAVYKGRQGSYIMKGAETAELQEALEDSMMILGGMASSRYALPFKEQVDEWVHTLGETGEVTERWLYLQVLWMNLEAVFTGGDIAKQLPQELTPSHHSTTGCVFHSSLFHDVPLRIRSVLARLTRAG